MADNIENSIASKDNSFETSNNVSETANSSEPSGNTDEASDNLKSKSKTAGANKSVAEVEVNFADTTESLTEVESNIADLEKKLAVMSARVEARKKEEASSMKEEVAEPITIDFVTTCARFLEKGDGLLHSSLFSGKYVYVPENKQWYVWKGHSWQPTHIHEVESSVEEVSAKYKEVAIHYRKKAQQAKDLGDDPSSKNFTSTAESLEKRSNTLNTSRGVSSCLKFTLANSNAPLITRADIWDADPWLLGVTNGVVDLRTGELREGRPSDYMYRRCNVEWKGLNEPAPKWEQSLLEIIDGSEGVLPYLHKVLGYAITGMSSEPLFLMLYGERGRNGKTVIMETLKKVLGPYMGPIKSEMLLDRNIPKDPDSASPTIMNLKGLRIVWASETNENRRFSSAQVKLLSGSDSLTGRYLWDREDTEFRPTHTLFLLTNFLPKAPAQDMAFWERMKLLDFPYRFIDEPKEELDKKRNPKLESELEEELSGILAWLVRGCLLYQKEGLKTPLAIIERTKAYRDEEDEVQAFIDECLKESEDKNKRLSASYLYEIYKEWHKKNISVKTVPSNQTFGRKLGSKIKKEKIGGRKWYLGMEVSEYGQRLAPDEWGKKKDK